MHIVNCKLHMPFLVVYSEFGVCPPTYLSRTWYCWCSGTVLCTPSVREKKPHAHLLKARSRVSFGSFSVGLGMFVCRGTASVKSCICYSPLPVSRLEFCSRNTNTISVLFFRIHKTFQPFAFHLDNISKSRRSLESVSTLQLACECTRVHWLHHANRSKLLRTQLDQTQKKRSEMSNIFCTQHLLNAMVVKANHQKTLRKNEIGRYNGKSHGDRMKNVSLSFTLIHVRGGCMLYATKSVAER